jgi:tetratricopeptide (TPR) repeat protein
MKMRRLLRVSVLSGVYAFLLHSVYAEEPGSLQLFAKGNELVLQGKYEEAVAPYQQLLAMGQESAALHYNLGIAYYRQNALGKAIFEFRHARKLRPRDPEVNFNLNYVRAKASDRIEASTQGLLVSFAERYPVSQRESLYMLLAALLWVTLTSSLLLFRHGEMLRWVQRASLLAFLGLAAAALCQQLGSKEFGVVISEKADVYSGQGAGSVVLFSVHEGAEFVLKDRDRQWLRIALADGKQGWVLAKQVVVTTESI